MCCVMCSLSSTMFPNILGHQTRTEAESGPEYLLLSVIHGLLNGECHPEIRLVGCSVLASPCLNNKMIKPCRSTCDKLRKDCAHAFEVIEMAWPYFLDCDRFFASEEEGCFDPLKGLKGIRHTVGLYSLDQSIPSTTAFLPKSFNYLLQLDRNWRCPAFLRKHPAPSSSSPTPPIARCTAY